MHDRARFRRKVLMDLIAAPSTVIPAALGASSMLISLAADGNAAVWAFAGLSGLLASAGILATRWIYGADRIIQRAYESLNEQDRRAKDRELDELDRRLRTDKDPRPEKCLAELRAMYDGFQRDSAWSGGVGQRSAVEIANKVEKLFQACIISLRRSQDLWETATRMRTNEARDAALAQRERLVEEIRQSVVQLAKTIDGVRSLAVQKEHDHDLSRIRQELDESLDVARRVEERMQSLEVELGPSAVESNRE
jgi:hypothetical protein